MNTAANGHQNSGQAPLMEKSVGGALFFCLETGHSQHKKYGFGTQNTAQSTKVPFCGKNMEKGVYNAPNRGYNVITVKENKAKLPGMGRG